MVDQYIAEFVGTTVLLFTGIATTGWNYRFLIVGLTLAVLIYLGGKLSDGPVSYNPAGTCVLYNAKKLTTSEATFYVVLELAAAIFAFGLAKQIINQKKSPA